MAKSHQKNKMAADTSCLDDTPICVVCGDKANGMHYRAMTCEGCKTFFRRNARNHLNLKCEMGSQKRCDMDLYTRRHCAACRMKKCFDMGMQIERLWDKDRLKTRKPITKKAAAEAALFKSENKAPTVTPNKQKRSKPDLADMVKNAYLLAATQPLSAQTEVAGTNPSSSQGESQPSTSSSSSSSSTSSSSSSSSSSLPSSSTSAGPSTSLPQTVPQSSEQMGYMHSKVGQHIAENLKSIELPNGFGEISQSLVIRALDVLLGLLKHLINFAKNLPAFLSLATEDQATLIKASFLEYVIISSASLYNPETETFESELWPEENWDFEKVSSVGFKRIYSSVIDVAVKVSKLKPSRAELTLLYAISIFTPERKDLCNSEDVEKMQQDLLQALRHSIEKRTDNSVGHFAKMIMLLTDVKNITDVFLEDVLSMQLQGAVLSPIMMEMFLE
ncbi:putative bile acid receptor [Apostichopus japonicus]|uniref:Putative bile acid receptor n=1 Tax=Stichopus japonicus TaxID=307972 RepID=A0A2G8JH31_STIJA|nr:putative bile acid receptor [Apostichopus japonicus]